MKPKLRFKEFTDDWEEKKLEEIADKNDRHSLTGGPFGSDLKSSDYTEDGVRIIQLQNILDGSFNNDYKIFTSIEKANQLKNCLIYPGEIIIAKMAEPLARACIIPDYVDKYLMASDGIRFKIDKLRHDTYFIMNYVNSSYFRKKAESKSTGTTRKRISLSVLSKINIQLPSLPEQEKIGTFLSLVDQRIEKAEKKVSLLKEEKKGWMQKLFQQEIRFKDEQGNDYPDWEEKKLGEVAKIYDGMHSTPNYTSYGIPFLSVENISDLETNKYISEEEYQNSFKNNKAEYGDIFMTRIGSIGVANINLRNEAAYYVSLALIKPQKINNWYLMYAIHSEQVQKDLWSKTLQVAFPQKINKGDINFVKVQLPSLPEQEKIANFLSLLDQRIEKEERKVGLLKEEKKGLLQNMFV